MSMDQVKTELARFTQSVKKNNQLDAASLADARKSAGFSIPIKHVIYVIKENRTFDQILRRSGEGPDGQNLPLFRREIHPNQHRLARQFGIYDNFSRQCGGQLQRHTWSTAGNQQRME